MTVIRILLADDHPVVRDGLRGMLAGEDGFCVVGEAASGPRRWPLRRPAEEALTAREVEVLELVARGSSNADIAAALFISEATVKTHLLHSFAKVGVDDRTAAVVAALERGVIALPRRRP